MKKKNKMVMVMSYWGGYHVPSIVLRASHFCGFVVSFLVKLDRLEESKR